MDGGAIANIPIRIPSRDALNFVDFEVLVAGREIEPRTEVRAFFDNAEITSQLRSLGLPLSVLDGNVTVAVKKLSAQDRSRLEKNNWVDCSLTRDDKCWPYWQSRIQFYWTQRFPAGQTVSVRHTYRPVVGGSVIYRLDDGATSVQPYCGGADALDQIKRQKQLRAPADDNDRPVLAERQVEYILTTANNWSGPIRSFHLTVDSDSPDDTVFTCMPGLKRVAPTRYELVRSNFRPDRELQLLVLQLNK